MSHTITDIFYMFYVTTTKSLIYSVVKYRNVQQVF